MKLDAAEKHVIERIKTKILQRGGECVWPSGHATLTAVWEHCPPEHRECILPFEEWYVNILLP